MFNVDINVALRNKIIPKSWDVLHLTHYLFFEGHGGCFTPLNRVIIRHFMVSRRFVSRKHKSLGIQVLISRCAHCSVTPKWSFQKLGDTVVIIVAGRWEHIECLVSGSAATLCCFSWQRVIWRRQSYVYIIVTFKILRKNSDLSSIQCWFIFIIRIMRAVHTHIFDRLSRLSSSWRESFITLKDIIST